MFYVFTSLIALSLLIVGAYAVATFHFRCRRAAPAVAGPFPRVSILKPMRNIDDELDENLSTFYTLDYPDYEIVFGVDELEDACVAIIEAVKARYPGVATKVIVTGSEKVMNPKIDSLAKIAPHCDGTLLWVSDSNTRVEKETLRELVREHADGAKIVFSPIRGTGSRTLGSVFTNAYLNFFVSGNILASWTVVKKAIIVGKSMLIERAALQAMGGFERFQEYLAEDYMMGELFAHAGMRVSTNATWITNFSSSMTVGGFLARMSRWSKLRRHIDPFFYVLEILTNPVIISLGAYAVLGAAALPLVVIAVAGKVLAEYIAFFAVNEMDRHRAAIVIFYPLIVIVKDVLLFGVYLVPFVSDTVNWRGRKIRIGTESRIKVVDGR